LLRATAVAVSESESLRFHVLCEKAGSRNECQTSNEGESVQHLAVSNNKMKFLAVGQFLTIKTFPARGAAESLEVVQRGPQKNTPRGFSFRQTETQATFFCDR
jgi:hypothetical protein